MPTYHIAPGIRCDGLNDMTVSFVVLHKVYNITATLLARQTSHPPRQTVGMHNLQASEEFTEVTNEAWSLQLLAFRHSAWQTRHTANLKWNTYSPKAFSKYTINFIKERDRSHFTRTGASIQFTHVRLLNVLRGQNI